VNVQSYTHNVEHRKL